MGELANADAIGTVGNSDCGEMLRMWVKFKEDKRQEGHRPGDIPIFRLRNGDRRRQPRDRIDSRQNA